MPNASRSNQTHWLWHVLGAIEVALISGLVYFFASGDLAPIAFELTPVKPLSQSVIQTDRLSELDQISIHPHAGAESIVYTNGTLYTGTVNGKILRIRDSNVDVIYDMVQKGCDSLETCGRPLGMRLTRNLGNLVFIDAFHGIFNLSLSRGDIFKIFIKNDSSQPIFLSDLDILPNGNILVSQTSLKYSLAQSFDEFMESRPNGRLLLIDSKTWKWRVFADGLHFPNGVQLHRDGKSVLVAETTRARILRVPLDWKSPSTVFVDGLPGYPDNIRRSPRGGYWIALTDVRGESHYSKMVEWLTRWPTLRRIVHRLASVHPWLDLGKSHSSMLLRVDEEGHVVEVWHDPKHRVTNVAEVCEADGHLFTGSNYLPFVGKVKL